MSPPTVESQSPSASFASEPKKPIKTTKSTKSSPTGIPVTELEKLKLHVEPVADSPHGKYKHEDLLASFPDVKWEPLGDIEVPKDVAIGADPEYKKLFANATKVEHLTPKIGTVLHGVKLADLDEDQKRELALLTAYRGVVFFKDQDDFDVDKQIELGKFFGPLHRHATTGIPKGWDPEKDTTGPRKDWDKVHVVHANIKKVQFSAYPAFYLWHSDVTYEAQPPSYTTLKLLAGPPGEGGAGGDTLWVSGYGLYDALSPALREYLEKHTALHSGVEQAEDAKNNGRTVRREPVVNEHPIIRTHPVTGYKSLFVNPGFTRKIVGVPTGESQAILKYLFDLVSTSSEITARFKWGANDVALWDNRITAHSASYGFFPHGRHAIRVTPHAEKPELKGGSSQQEVLDEFYGSRSVELDGSQGANYND